jgi:hypothetical protein
MKIAEDLQNAVLAAPGATKFCLVLEWDEGPALHGVTSLATRQERRTAIREATARVKAPVLAALRKRSSVDVNDLEGTGQAVVAASADQWRQLFGHPALRKAPLRIVPNERFDAHD